MQWHAAAARSEAAECRALQQLRSVYFHWPSVLGLHSSQSELQFGLSRQDQSIHPSSVRPAVHISPSIQRCAASASAKVRHIIFDQRTCQLFSFLIYLIQISVSSSGFYYCIKRSLVSLSASVFTSGASLQETALRHWGVETIKPMVRPEGLIFS